MTTTELIKHTIDGDTIVDGDIETVKTAMIEQYKEMCEE